MKKYLLISLGILAIANSSFALVVMSPTSNPQTIYNQKIGPGVTRVVIDTNQYGINGDTTLTFILSPSEDPPDNVSIAFEEIPYCTSYNPDSFTLSSSQPQYQVQYQHGACGGIIFNISNALKKS